MRYARYAVTLVLLSVLQAVSQAQTFAKQPTHASPTAIMGCVSKSTGHGRVLVGKLACDATSETAVTWTVNSQLPHVVDVPATSDAVANGTALNNLLEMGQSISTPYVVQLDAGTYAVFATQSVFPWVSLQGAGMYSTIIEPSAAFPIVGGGGYATLELCTLSACFGPYPPGQANWTQSLSNLTIVGASQSQPLIIGPAGLATVDHVNVVGATFDNPVKINMAGSLSRFTISNSILGPTQVATQGDNNIEPGNTLSTIVATQFEQDGVTGFGTAKLLCLGDYNSAGVIFNTDCSLPQ